MNVPSRSPLRSSPLKQRRRITIGLINNMSDEALRITERQFGGLVSDAADGVGVRFRIFSLKSTRRSPRALDYIQAHYEPVSVAMEGGLDGLIITGAQPRADRLNDEPYWEELVELIDWAKLHTTSTMLSCLAAHAGVLHLDGVERLPLPEKCTGVFASAAQITHPLVGEQGRVRLVPHSRYNGLSRTELEQAGYAILTSSRECGVDIFVKCFGSEFVFLQGHPEYDANSLAREYRRDMDRYLRGETGKKPTRPKAYFSIEAEAKLDAMERASRGDGPPMQIEDVSNIDAAAPIEPTWREAAIGFFRGWLEMIANNADPRTHAALCAPIDEFGLQQSLQ